MSLRDTELTVWLFICPNEDGFHGTRNGGSQASFYLENEYVEYLMVSNVMVSRSEHPELKGERLMYTYRVRRSDGEFTLIDDPSDAWVMAILAILRGAEVMRISRTCRFCKAKGCK